jgi:hypothetical protein
MFSIRMLVSKTKLPQYNRKYSSNIINNKYITKLSQYNRKYSIQSEKPEQSTQSKNVEECSILSIPLALIGVITFMYSICTIHNIYAGTYVVPLQFNNCNCRDCR